MVSMDKATSERMVTELIYAYQRFYTTPTHESNTVVENYADAKLKIIDALTTPEPATKPENPNHTCGPESNCDGICVEYAARVPPEATPSKPDESLPVAWAVKRAISPDIWETFQSEKYAREYLQQNIKVGNLIGPESDWEIFPIYRDTNPHTIGFVKDGG